MLTGKIELKSVFWFAVCLFLELGGFGRSKVLLGLSSYDNLGKLLVSYDTFDYGTLTSSQPHQILSKFDKKAHYP